MRQWRRLRLDGQQQSVLAAESRDNLCHDRRQVVTTRRVEEILLCEGWLKFPKKVTYPEKTKKIMKFMCMVSLDLDGIIYLLGTPVVCCRRASF